jgi:threonylcarbamoyladenosine tRNA methylthiotransferase MtaB
LRAKGETALAMRLQALAGTEQDILVEKPGEGRTPCFATVRCHGAATPGDIVRVRTTGTDGRMLVGEAACPSRRAVA